MYIVDVNVGKRRLNSRMRMVGVLRIPGFFLAKKDILYIWPVVRDEQQGDSDCIGTKLA